MEHITSFPNDKRIKNLADFYVVIPSPLVSHFALEILKSKHELLI